MKRIGCIVLALLLLLSGALLTSCGDNPDPNALLSNPTQTQEEARDKYAAYGFADVDLENRPYCLLTLSGYNDSNYFVVSDESGTVLGDVAFRRTQYVNDKYNCDLMYWEGNPEMLINAAKRECGILSGDPANEEYSILRTHVYAMDGMKEFR